VLLTNAGCGPKPSEWYASYDPASQSLKTRQVSLFCPTSTESLEKLPRSAMICGGMLYPLPPLVPDISANASSLSLPTVRAGKHTSENEETWLKRNADGKVSTPPLALAVKLLPTPVAADGERGPDYAKANRPGSGADDLVTHMARATLLPTPTTRDYKDTPGMTLETEDGRMRDDQLPRRVFQTCADASAEPIGGMKLTPEFLCWLMGFPPNWLKPLVAALATPSSRKSPKSSPKPSANPF